MRNAQTLIIVNEEKLIFDSSIKDIIKKEGNAFVQVMREEKDEEETFRAIRSIISDFTSNGNVHVNVVLSGFDYSPEIIDIIDENNSKLIWAC